MTFAQICVKVRMCYSGRRAISFCCRKSMFPNGRRNSSALSDPIDCLNLQSSFLPLTVYGRPAHQEGRRFCTHSLRRLFRCLLGRMPRRRIGPSSGWSGCAHRTRQGCFHRCSEQVGFFVISHFSAPCFFLGFIQFPMSLRTDSMKFALSA